jgi:hypothetical protein
VLQVACRFFATHVVAFEFVHSPHDFRGEHHHFGKQQVRLFGVVQALREFVDVKQHAAQHVKELASVVGRPFFHHEPHGLQHGGQACMFVADGLKGALALHENSP